MGIIVYSLSWAMQDLYYQPYCSKHLRLRGFGVQNSFEVYKRVRGLRFRITESKGFYIVRLHTSVLARGNPPR